MANLWLEVRDAVNLKKVRHFPPRAPDHPTTKVEKYSSNTQSGQTRKVQNSNLFFLLRESPNLYSNSCPCILFTKGKILYWAPIFLNNSIFSIYNCTEIDCPH